MRWTHHFGELAKKLLKDAPNDFAKRISASKTSKTWRITEFILNMDKKSYFLYHFSLTVFKSK